MDLCLVKPLLFLHNPKLYPPGKVTTFLVSVLDLYIRTLKSRTPTISLGVHIYSNRPFRISSFSFYCSCCGLTGYKFSFFFSSTVSLYSFTILLSSLGSLSHQYLQVSSFTVHRDSSVPPVPFPVLLRPLFFYVNKQVQSLIRTSWVIHVEDKFRDPYFVTCFIFYF